MSTTDLKLDVPGTLPRPGPLGRLLRLAIGIWCAYALWQIWQSWPRLVSGDETLLAGFSITIAVAILISNYVINIGYSRDWGKRPMAALLVVFVLAALAGQLATGSPFAPPLGWALALWLTYFFAHLGFCFLLSALLGTPGCEMRALHHLYERVSGRPVKEHYCPVGPLHALDQWEAKRR